MIDTRAIRQWVLGVFLVGLAFSITLSESALALLAALWLLRLRDPSARRVRGIPLAGPVLAFAAATLLSAIRSGNPAASVIESKGLLLLFTLYVVVDALPDVQAADRFVTGLFLLLAVHAGLGVVQVVACPQDPWGLPLVGRFFRRCDRAHGFFSIYMTLAGVLTLTLLATLPRFAPGAGRRWWTPVAWAISGLALVLTYTRGAWLGFVAGAAALSLLLRRFWAMAAAGGVLLLSLLLLLPVGNLEHRLRRTLEDPATLRERLYMWQSGLQMVRDHPLTGVGVGQVKVLFPRYARPEAIRKTTSHVHNTPLQILVERGVLGLAAWVWIWVAFFVRAGGLLGRLGPDQGRERALVAGSLAAIAGFLVAGLSEFNFGDSEVVLVAFAVMALPFVVERSLGPPHPAFSPTGGEDQR